MKKQNMYFLSLLFAGLSCAPDQKTTVAPSHEGQKPNSQNSSDPLESGISIEVSKLSYQNKEQTPREFAMNFQELQGPFSLEYFVKYSDDKIIKNEENYESANTFEKITFKNIKKNEKIDLLLSFKKEGKSIISCKSFQVDTSLENPKALMECLKSSLAVDVQELPELSSVKIEPILKMTDALEEIRESFKNKDVLGFQAPLKDNDYFKEAQMLFSFDNKNKKLTFSIEQKTGQKIYLKGEKSLELEEFFEFLKKNKELEFVGKENLIHEKETTIKIKAHKEVQKYRVDDKYEEYQVQIELICDIFSSSSLFNLGTYHFLQNTDTKPTAEKIRVGVVNMENLWDDIPNNNTPYDDYSADKSNWYSPGILESKVKNILKQIELMNSDIIGLVEIEYNRDEIERVWKLPVLVENKKSTFGAELEKKGYKHKVLGIQNKIEGHKDVAVTTAVISKYPFVYKEALEIKPDKIVSESESGIPSDRDIQIADVNLGADSLRLLLGHWKSKGGDAEESHKARMETAQKVRAYINNNLNKNIIVLGDLNTYYYEDILVDGLESTGNEEEVFKGSSKLYNLWNEFEFQKRWSDHFNGHRDTLMNMLIGSSFYDGEGIDYKDNSFEVIGQDPQSEAGKVLLDSLGLPFRWVIGTDKPGKNSRIKHFGMGFSDHLPIVAEFYWPTKKIEAFKPSSIKTWGSSPEPIPSFSKDKVCQKEKALVIESLNLEKLNDYKGQCIYLKNEEGYELTSVGSFYSMAIKYKNTILGISMMDGFSPLPNPILYPKATSELTEKCGSACDARSNMAFERLFLQKKKNDKIKLTEALGILDIKSDTGYYTIMVAHGKDLTLKGVDSSAEGFKFYQIYHP